MAVLRNYVDLLLAQIAHIMRLPVGWAALALMPLWLVGQHIDSDRSLPEEASNHHQAQAWTEALQFTDAAALLHQNPALRERAFMEAIALAEGNAAYNELYGHEVIHDLSQHPNRCKPVRIRGYEQMCTTAAGRWQITADTWNEYANRLNVRDFSPTAQYKVARAIAKDTGALTLLGEGNLIGAMAAASKRWASLPHSPADQRQISEEQFLVLYKRSLRAELEAH